MRLITSDASHMSTSFVIYGKHFIPVQSYCLHHVNERLPLPPHTTHWSHYPSVSSSAIQNWKRYFSREGFRFNSVSPVWTLEKLVKRKALVPDSCMWRDWHASVHPTCSLRKEEKTFCIHQYRRYSHCKERGFHDLVGQTFLPPMYTCCWHWTEQEPCKIESGRFFRCCLLMLGAIAVSNNTSTTLLSIGKLLRSTPAAREKQPLLSLQQVTREHSCKIHAEHQWAWNSLLPGALPLECVSVTARSEISETPGLIRCGLSM